MKFHVLRYVAIVLFSLGSLVAGWVLAVGVAVNSDGITFPDGTVQMTAVGNEVKHPFMTSGNVTLNEGELVTSKTLEDLPEGFVAVIEFVSTRCISNKQNYITELDLVVVEPEPGGGIISHSFPIPITDRNIHDDVPQSYYDTGALATRVHSYGLGTSNDEIRFVVHRSENSGVTVCEFAVSGYLQALEIGDVL